MSVPLPSGGYHSEHHAERVVARMVPTLQGLQNTRVIVEGYMDNQAVGPQLRDEGISSNLDLSSRRADNPIASNETLAGRAQKRRIEVTLVEPVD